MFLCFSTKSIFYRSKDGGYESLNNDQISLACLRLILPRPLLVTFAYSHYCETARWALEHRNLSFREFKVPVGPHAFIVAILRLVFFRWTDTDTDTSFPGSDQSHPWYSLARWRFMRRLSGVPLLITDDAKVLTTSWAILDSANLPVDPTTRATLDDELGPAVRTLAYFHIFEHNPALYIALQSAEPWAMQLFDLCERS